MGSLGRASQGRQLLAQGQVLQDQLSMSTARQRQRTDDDDEQLQHASIVAAVAARFNKDEFWRGSAHGEHAGSATSQKRNSRLVLVTAGI